MLVLTLGSIPDAVENFHRLPAVFSVADFGDAPQPAVGRELSQTQSAAAPDALAQVNSCSDAEGKQCYRLSRKIYFSLRTISRLASSVFVSQDTESRGILPVNCYNPIRTI